MVAEKSDATVYSVTIIVCTLIGFALGYYNTMKENDKMVRDSARMFYSGMGLFIGVWLALWLDGSDMFEGYQIEEKMEEEKKEDELTLD